MYNSIDFRLSSLDNDDDLVVYFVSHAAKNDDSLY